MHITVTSCNIEKFILHQLLVKIQCFQNFSLYRGQKSASSVVLFDNTNHHINAQQASTKKLYILQKLKWSNLAAF